MGKSNRIRNQRASATLGGAVKPSNKKSGMPSWAINLIAISIAVVVVLSVVLSLLSANGVFGRITPAMKTDNFTVNSNVMNYFFRTTYNNFTSDNSTHLSSMKLDTSKSLKEQYYLGDASLGTWFDMFMDQTKEEVKTMLLLCEEAHKRGITLSDEEKANIEAEISIYDIYANAYGYASVDSYIAAVYGAGMKVKDIEKALELTALASKCGGVISEELYDAITSEEIDAEYLENKDKYDLADYAFYSYKVTYEDAIKEVLGEKYEKDDAEAKKDEILAKYKELIEDAKAKAAELAAKTELDDFKGYILDKVLEEVYDEGYEDYINDADIKEEETPSEENLKTIREKTLAHLKTLILEKKDYEDLTKEEEKKFYLFDIEISSTFAEYYEEMVLAIIDDALKDYESYVVEGGAYKDSVEGIKWAFEDGENGRKAGDITTIEDGDGADGKEFAEKTEDLKSFTVDVYYSIKPRYRDEALTREIGIMLFSTEDAAKAAIEKLSAGMSLEDFEAVCNDLTGTYAHYENYSKGSMGISDFDSWLYDEATTKGTFTAKPIEISKGQSYAVAIYAADGDAEWYVDVKDVILEADYQDALKALGEKYTVIVKDKTIAKIDA